MTTIQSLPPLPAHVHFVGIGGIGMSGLARILKTCGYRVTGSDSARSEQVELLIAEGFVVEVGHNATAAATSAALVVATAAVRDSNPELQAARDNNVPIIKRAELLGLLANARTCIAVAGSHGKSTTSGMIVTALRALGSDPSYSVGAIVASTGTNAAPGSDELMVVEADEYDHSFLWLKPQLGIITNIDYDHPDLFPDQATYDLAFTRFAGGFPDGSHLAVNADDQGVQRALPELVASSAQIVTYGRLGAANWQIRNSVVRCPSGETVTLNLAVPGAHNISNATASLVVLAELGFKLSESARAVESFAGVGRRFELKGEIGGITIIDDYAHHPEEIRVTIAAARERYPDRRIVAAFQPHTYSRTRMLAAEFASALDSADEVVVLDIYAARETDTLGTSSSSVIELMENGAVAGGLPDHAVNELADIARSGDVILTMGAGDITAVGGKLLEALAGTHR